MSLLPTWLTRLFGRRSSQRPVEPRTTTYPSDTGLVEITSPMEGEADAERHAFIVENWMRLAAAAYVGFQRHGIGVVVVEEQAERTASAKHPFRAHTLRYALAEGAWMRRRRSSPALTWLEEQLQTYDPQEAALLFFSDEKKTSHIYRAEGTPGPPQALKEVRAPLN